jgi:hypothetical protein
MDFVLPASNTGDIFVRVAGEREICIDRAIEQEGKFRVIAGICMMKEDVPLLVKKLQELL